MKILSFGSCNIDYVYTVPHFVRSGETLNADRLNHFAGGKGLNQSIAIAKSGCKVWHAGCIGSDGNFLKETLEKAGVDTHFLKTVDTPTGHTIIQVDSSGENSIILYGGANKCITKEFVDSVLENFEYGDILVLQNEINELGYIITSAYKIGMKIIFNPSPINENLKLLELDKIHTVILNEGEAKELTCTKTPEEALSYFKSRYPELHIVLTLGKRGCIYFSKNSGTVFCPAFSVKTVDTTCAGDTFSGYFVNLLTQKIKISRALKISSAASAIAVSRRGAAASIPTMREVMRALPSLNELNFSKTLECKQTVLRYIDCHLKDASLEELSSILGYCKTYTTTWIKDCFGENSTDILKRKRCENAAKLLLETSLSIEEIIKLSGYENGSFFRNNFKKHYGCTPLEYRKLYTKGGQKND